MYNNLINQHLFPNPLNSDYQFNFEATEPSTTTLELIDSNGKQVHVQTFMPEAGLNILHISALSTLPNGVYFQRVSTAEETITTKLIKQ